MANNIKQNDDSTKHRNSAHGFKIKLPDSVVPIPAKDLKNISEKDSVELWLVQVPRGFDVTKLDKVDAGIFTINGSQSFKVKVNQDEGNKEEHSVQPGEDQRVSKQYFTVHSYRDSPSCRNMTTVVHKNQEVVLGRDLQHMLVVSERVKPPQLETPSISPSPRKPVPMPTGLQARCTTFGTGAPCPSAPKSSKKRKKRATLSEDEQQSPKKRRKDSLAKGNSPVLELVSHTPEASLLHTPEQHRTTASMPNSSIMDAECTTPEVSLRKKHKKHKHKESRQSSPSPSDSSQSQGSIVTPPDTLPQVSPSKSAKRKWNQSVIELAEAQAHTPSKEKKLKASSSDSGVFINGDGADVSLDPETSRRKKKQHKRSRTVEEEEATQTLSSGEEGLFVVDRLGDRTPEGEDSLSSRKKHRKKSKKEKK